MKGSNGSIYALGDAATIDQPKAVVRAKVGGSSVHTGPLKPQGSVLRLTVLPGAWQLPLALIGLRSH